MTRSARPAAVHSFAAMAAAAVLLLFSRTAVAESTLSINSFPAAKVIIDGKTVGNTPLLKLKVTPGRHRVQFVRNGSRVTRTVTVKKGQHQRLIVKLDKAPATHRKSSGRLYGTLQISSIPWAKVFLDGKQIGITPLRAIRIKAGHHVLRLTNPKHGSITRRVKITPGKTTRLAVSLGTKKLAAMTTPAKPVATGDGLFEVRAKPNAIVFVAGKRIGPTPIRRHALPAGQHRIIVVQQDIATTHDVMIRHGKTTRLDLSIR